LTFANSSAVTIGLRCLGLEVRFPLPWLISQVRVNICVKNLSWVQLYVCPSWKKL